MISVIIPCYNEEKNIGRLISEIKKYIPINSQIIVVDNNSKDRTFEKARESGAIVIKEEKKGKGRAIIAGVKKAKGDILFFIDGDNAYFPKAIPEMANLLKKNKSGIVYGSRFLKGSKTSISFFRLLGNKFFSFLGYLLYRKKTDFLTGLFAIKKEKFFEINPKSGGFEIETEIFTKAVKRNLKVKEVPIEYKANKESKINPIIDGTKIFFTLIKNRL